MYGRGNRNTFQRMLRRRPISPVSSQEKFMSWPWGFTESRNRRIGSRPCSSITSPGSTKMPFDLDIPRPSGMLA
jgi:hypothetical protein